MKTAEKFFKVADKIVYVLAALCVGGMLFCVFLQVLARFFQLRIVWTTELSQYFFLWSTTFASFIAARRGKLIGVELLQKKLPGVTQRIVRCLAQACGAFFYALVIYYCVIQLPNLMVQSTAILKWPVGMLYIIMILGLAMLSIYFLYSGVVSLLPEQGKETDEAEKTAEQRAEEVE